MRTPEVGIIGGLGPRASAEFVKTIYEFGQYACEQEAPFILLSSDPGYPDRTEAFNTGRERILLDRLTADLEWFRSVGISNTVICCVTIHHLLPQLPRDLREQVISLVSTAIDGVIEIGTRCLLLCSSGTRALNIFDNDPSWDLARPDIVLPGERDQQRVHELIYRIKANEPIAPLVPLVRHLMARHGVNAFVAGCTELHVFIREAARLGLDDESWHYVDPLTTLAKAIAVGGLRAKCNA